MFKEKKNSSSIFLLYFVVVFFLSGNVYSENRVVIDDMGQGTALPEGSVNCLLQDSTGFIWLGTWKGLFRYDGYGVVNFSSINPAFDALKIQTLLLNGNDLWVGTFVSGLFRINLLTYEIDVFHSSAGLDRQISDNNIIALAAMPDNRILVGTERGGLNVISPSNKVVKSYTPDSHPEILQSRQVSAISVIDNARVVLGNISLVILNPDTDEARRIDNNLFINHISGIEVLNDDNFLIYTLENLFKVDLSENKTDVELILNAPIKFIKPKDEHSKSSFFIGKASGIYSYNISKNEFVPYISEETDFFPHFELNDLLISSDGVLIIGAESGLYSLIERNHIFQKINTSSSDESPDIISNIIEAGNKLFAGTWGKGIFEFNSESKTLEPVHFNFSGNQQPRFIFSMENIDNKIWFSSKSHLGIFNFDYKSNTQNLKHYQYFRNIDNQDVTYTVTSIIETGNSDVLIGTWEGIILYFNENDDRFEVLTDNKGKLPLSESFHINSIMQDNQGFTWLALSGGGVLKIRILDRTIVSQELFTTDDGLCSNFTTTLYQSRNNKIWIGTEAGLNIFENNSFISKYKRDIILDIQSVIEDPIGFLWLGTQKGLVRLNSNNIDDPIKIFDQSDGLENRTYYLNSVFADNNFALYFGGFNGIDFFTPYRIDYNFNKPEPHITSFSLFNEKIYPVSESNAEILDNNIFNTNTLELEHNQNSFSFEFSNLEYKVQDKCQFAFMLEGVDIDWNFRGSLQRYAYYTKLKPGNYTFYLRSTNNDGVWGDNPVKLSIIISPPFWASTLAYIIYFITGMILIFVVVYNRLIKVQQKHKLKIKELEYKKQKELNELKLRFFTNISHEFRTPLTLIMGPLARILENEKNDQFKDSHLMIFRNANRLLHLTNRIMEFRKSENAQLKLSVEPTPISDFIYNIFLFFNYEAQKRNIDYRFKTHHEGEILIDKEYIESVAFNLLSNAFKYTHNGKSITVTVKGDNEKVYIEISDTGKGIRTEEIKNIFERFYSTSNKNSTGIGLSFSQRLISIHKGNIDVNSIYGQGSTFVVSLPATDVYSEEEKNDIENREQVIDWKKIDQSVHSSVNNDMVKLKALFGKDELLALVVDDNIEVREFIKSLLDSTFNILEASNGREALDLAFNHIPDIVISDVMMPELDGFQLCKKLKTDSRTDHIPVILTTVLSAQTDRIEGLSLGADSYIPKPIDPDHLLIRVNKLIEKQLKLKEKFNLKQYAQKEKEKAEESKPEIHPLVEKARNIVLENLDNSDYNIDDFCSDLGLSRMQLYRKFKAITGLSANIFIRKVRLHEAAKMLKTGNYSIKEVTYDVGFIDLKYFRKCFNEEFGINPSEYAQIQSNRSTKE